MTRRLKLFLIAFIILVSASVGFGQENYDGIWKDTGPTMTFYIQTYVTGSAIIIATADLSNFLVFLDQDFSDGISEVSDLSAQGHQGHSLTIDFDSMDSGTANIEYPTGSSKSWTISKVFEGNQTEDRELGIFKPSEGTLISVHQNINLYLQTYSTGSAVFIFTPDLQQWYVFLAPDWNGQSYSGTDLAGEGHHLALDLTSDQTGTAEITYANGSTDKWQMLKRFSAPHKKVVICASARPLTQSTTDNLVSISPDGTLTFSGSDEEILRLQAGDVIVGAPCQAAPYGFLRKVVSMGVSSAAEGSQVDIHTQSATLSEVFEEGAMEASGTITSYDIANQLTGSHKLSSAGTDYEVRFLPIPQKSAPMNMDASNVVIPVEITLEGTGTTFLGEFIFDIDWYFKVEFGLFPFINYAVFKAMPSIKTRLVCSSSVSVSLYKISLSLLPKPIELSPIFVPTPIGVPIMVVPKVDLDLEVQPGVTFQDMKSGLDYKLVNTTGVEYKNFNLSPIFILDQKLTPIYEYTGTQSNTYIRAGISPEIGLYIYNVLGGYFSAGPFFEFEIDPSRDPLLELWFGMGASVGIELEVFTYEVLDIAWNFLETKVLAWEVRLHLPIIKSFFINNNDYETTSREVVLVHTAENEPTFFMASESPSFSGTSWQTYDPSPSITLSPGNGTKTVHFKLKNSAGESAVASDSIELVVEPQVQFYQINNGASYTTSHMVTLNNSVLCNPTEYMASESQSFSAASWKAYSSSPSFTLSSGYGSKTVYFKARNSAGESSVTSDSIDIVGSSVAAFSGSPTSGAAPLSVSFTDQSTNNPTSWSWNFGDGSSSSTRNPSHTYTSAGVYTVTLTASNAYGSDSETKSNYIRVESPGQPPVAAFSGSPTSGAAPLSVSFTDQSTNNPTSWSWNFGDGSNSSAQNPTHTYSSPGNYTVTLTVSNAYGSDSETKSNYIVAIEDVTEPEVTYFQINNGAGTTTTQLVTLNNTTANIPSQYMASESPSFAGASWITYSASPCFTLSSGSGPKTLYFKARNESGESAVASDTIEAKFISVSSPDLAGLCDEELMDDLIIFTNFNKSSIGSYNFYWNGRVVQFGTGYSPPTGFDPGDYDYYTGGLQILIGGNCGEGIPDAIWIDVVENQLVVKVLFTPIGVLADWSSSFAQNEYWTIRCGQNYLASTNPSMSMSGYVEFKKVQCVTE